MTKKRSITLEIDGPLHLAAYADLAHAIYRSRWRQSPGSPGRRFESQRCDAYRFLAAMGDVVAEEEFATDVDALA